ncbi:MAG: GHKL domain-containing protein [Bdellovibrionales bacterium]|nr:GHKL domain-containing protein [Bdellovibrionales bacterium]
MPLVLLTTTVIIAWISLLLRQYYDLRKYQTDQVQQHANLMQIPVTRKDRVILETLVGSVFLNTNSRSVAICHNNKSLISLGWRSGFCKNSVDSVFQRVLSSNIGGLEGYRLVASTPIFPNGSFWLALVMGGILVGASLIIVYRLQSSIRECILVPLNGEQTFEVIQIKEVDDLLRKQELAKQAEVHKATFKVAKQVAHDIRSPLSCLDAISKRSDGLNFEEKDLINRSITRISEIAEDLLLRDRPQKSIPPTLNNEMVLNRNIPISEPVHIPIVISEILSESLESKRVECSTLENIKFSKMIEPEAMDTLLALDPNGLKRVLSNLFNNAVESIKPNCRGLISASLSKENENLILEIRDTGAGISPSDLKKIIEKGISIGKANGNGLGITSAQSFMKGLNGKFDIYSKEGFGTTVRLTF